MATMRMSKHPVDLRLKEMGKSRKWLADQCGVSEQFIGRICSRQVRAWRPGHITTARLMKALEVDANYLVLGPK
jgi:predicted transcriptional regulator